VAFPRKGALSGNHFVQHSTERKDPASSNRRIHGDFLEADLWIASILANSLFVFFRRGEPVGMYEE
jgi:hypothetical protein